MKRPRNFSPLTGARIALGLWAGLIFVLSVMPTDTVAAPITVSDFFLHLGFYAPLGIFLFLSLPRASMLKTVALAAAIALLFGGGLEVAQWFLPYRNFEFTDGLANALGGGAGAAAAALVRGTITRT